MTDPPADPMRRPNGQGITGHAPTQHAIDAYRSDWYCACGLYLGRGRRAARAAQREHIEIIRKYPAETLRDRVLGRLIVDSSGCLLWTGACNNWGYGKVSVGRRTELVHRLMYQWFIGPIPPSMEIDHVKSRGCAHKHCANPAHLEAVTGRENKLRADGIIAAHATATNCGTCGTPYDDLNTYRTPAGHRDCRACRREANRRRMERKRSA